MGRIEISDLNVNGCLNLRRQAQNKKLMWTYNMFVLRNYLTKA